MGGRPDALNTHDWEVWVKSPSDSRIESYMEKVVFNLHETFENNKRTVSKPPFMIKESGYGSFTVNIDLYFKAPKGEKSLEKTRVAYELILQPMHKPGDEGYVKENTYKRLERMQFPTKDEDFKRRLLKGGAKPVGNKEGDKKSGDKTKDKGRREKDKERERKEKKDEKYRDREKDREKDKDKSRDKLGLFEEKPKAVKPKSDFTDLFGTPIKKSTEVLKGKEKEKNEKSSSSSSLTKEKESPSSKTPKEKDKDKEKERHHKSHSKDRDRDKDKEKPSKDKKSSSHS